MRHASFLLLGIAMWASAAEVDPAKIVKDQLELIRPNLERAKNEYAKRVTAENDRLCKAIESAMTKETKAGNLDNALALKAALEKAKAGEFIEDILNPPPLDLLGTSDGDEILFPASESRILLNMRMEDGNIAFWTDGGKAEFTKPVNPGRYKVAVEISTSGAFENTITVMIGSKQVEASNIGSKGWKDFVWVELGDIDVPTRTSTVTLKGAAKGTYVANLRQLRLTPR